MVIAVVGLGYVGLPLAVAFAKVHTVIGFDVNLEKINSYRRGIDVTNEVGDEALSSISIRYTTQAADLREAAFIIIGVPTPVDAFKTPDLSHLQRASVIVGQNLQWGATVVYESTVWPGVTEDVCVPILERESGLKCGIDFKVGYSPERINPGDKVHRLESIVKVVAGCDADALDSIATMYGKIITAGVYRATSIKVAEAAKVIENAQRDINIAFVNELAMIFHRMGLDTLEVLKAAGTKWNFLNFRPGLVGGHCIGVDPYYLTYKAQELGYRPEIILAGRRINDCMGKYVAEQTIKQLVKTNGITAHAKVLIMGITFKENVADIRNSRVIDIVRELEEYGIEVSVCDPVGDKADTLEEYGLSLVEFEEVGNYDAVILAVAHDVYRSLTLADIKAKLAPKRNVLVDVKGVFERQSAEALGLSYWRL